MFLLLLVPKFKVVWAIANLLNKAKRNVFKIRK
jgi:hypothetical protein